MTNLWSRSHLQGTNELIIYLHENKCKWVCKKISETTMECNDIFMSVLRKLRGTIVNIMLPPRVLFTAARFILLPRILFSPPRVLFYHREIYFPTASFILLPRVLFYRREFCFTAASFIFTTATLIFTTASIFLPPRVLFYCPEI